MKTENTEKAFEILTSEQFNEILDAQMELNVKYSGENWAKDIPDSHMLAAAFAELGELLESGPRVGDSDLNGWKWWRENLDNDDNNLKVEAVDIIHFTFSSLAKKYNDIDLLKKHYAECSNAYRTSPNAQSDGESTGVVYDLLLSLSVFTVTCLIEDSEKEQLMDMMVFLVNGLCRFSNMTADEMFELYGKKNKLNHKRVEGGYKTGDYEKVDSDGNEDNVKLFED